MTLASNVDAFATEVGTDVKALLAKSTLYQTPIYVLEANQSEADIPSSFPANGLVFQKTS